MLIAGIDEIGLFGHKWLIAQAKGSVPLFDPKFQQFVVTTSWLDSIWFSPQGIKDYSSVFNKITEDRKNNCPTDSNNGPCKQLTYSVASYPLEWEDFVGKLVGARPPFTLPLKSIMIDIDDQPEYRNNQ